MLDDISCGSSHGEGGNSSSDEPQAQLVDPEIENSTVLGLFLDFLYHRELPDPSTYCFYTLRGTIRFAKKWEFHGMLQMIGLMLQKWVLEENTVEPRKVFVLGAEMNDYCTAITSIRIAQHCDGPLLSRFRPQWLELSDWRELPPEYSYALAGCWSMLHTKPKSDWGAEPLPQPSMADCFELRIREALRIGK